MRFRLGLSGCLLAGCMAQPTTTSPVDAALATARASGRPADTAGPEVARHVPPATFVLRIGVEHLPPDDDTPVDAPRSEPVATPVTNLRPTTDVDARPSARERPLLELADTDDPLAHEALHFVSDLVEADRLRVRRQVGLPFFDFREIDVDRGPLLASEQDLLTDQEEWIRDHGLSLLQRPVRQMLKRLPFVRDVEVEFENFRSQNVPLSEPWQAVHDRRRRSGRISLRLHVDDLDDPVEVAWVWAGLRIGSSQEHGKLGLDLPITDALQLQLRARTDYATDETGFRLDLGWRRSLSTSVHVAIGDDMDFLSTSSIYSLFESPMDGSPGLVLYAVHIF